MYASTAPDAYALYLGAATLSHGNRLQSAERVWSRSVAYTAESPELTTLVAGGVGGAVSRTFTAPLDRLKILAQEGRAMQYTMPHPTLQSPARSACDSELMLALVRYVLHYEGGVKGFWRGNGVNCLKAGPEYATAFTARQYYVQNICANPSKPSFLENTIVGAAGGATAQMIWYPLELVKQRMAASKHGEYNSISDCFGQTIRKDGLKGLYTGCAANLAGIIPHRGLEMGLFFTLQQSVDAAWGGNGTAPIWATTVVGFIASFFAQCATYPLNLARTRIQTQGVNGRPMKYTGLGNCLRTVVREEGVRGLFAGILPNMLKAVPASIIMFVTFNETQRYIKSKKE